MTKTRFAQILFPLTAGLCLTPWVSSALALVMGITLAVLFGNPYIELTKKWTHVLLQVSVIGLGAGMNLIVVGRVGLAGVGYTVLGIGFSFIVGLLLGKAFAVAKDTSLLITVGTAICGGSAIAAVAPVIRAKSQDVSVALGTVFCLNALALIIFPPIGHYFGLDEGQFGLWSALAIHDTSSVVGSAMQYGAHALEVGTTIKLARALWIVPVALSIGFLRARSEPETGGAGRPKAKLPWFILGFLIMAALVTWIPELRPAGHVVELVARKTLVLTLFLIGANLTLATLKSVGFKPFAQGVALWVIVASGTLAAIVGGLIMP